MAEAGYGTAPFKPPPLAELPPLELLGPDCIAMLVNELSWIALPGGQILFQEGEPAEALYLLTTGVLGVIATTAEQGQLLVAEVHAGETVGEMSLISGDTHSATVVALRHSEFYQMPKAVFDRLVIEEPKFLAWITRLLVQRLHRTTKRTKIAEHASVALVPLDDSVPIEAVAAGIIAALKREGLSAFRFEPSATDHSVEWFDELESAHNVVIYQAEPIHTGTTPWCRFCLRQTDRVVLIGMPGSAIPDPLPLPANGKAGQQPTVDLVIIEAMERGRTGTVPEAPAALRHDPPFAPARPGRCRAAGAPSGRARGRAGAVGRCGARLRPYRCHPRAARGRRVDRPGRRHQHGRHLAAGVAAGWDDRELRDRIHQAFVRTNPLNDYTVPWVALFRGETVNRLLREHFGQTVISALWRPFFAVSTNLTRGGLRVHRHGVLWRALRASIAIPGVLPPLLDDEEVLVDGGVVDNFPVDIMAGNGRGPIVGVDVGGAMALMPGTEVPLNRRGLMGFLRPDPGRLPGIVSVLSRVGTVSSTLQTSLAQAQLSLLIQPPIADVPLLDWQSFDRAVEAGYRATEAAIATADLKALQIAAIS